MNRAEFVLMGLRMTSLWMNLSTVEANRKTSAGSIYMKEIRHRVRANSQQSPQTAKKDVERALVLI